MYGEIAAAMTAAPCRVSRAATQPMRSMFVSRSSFEKPRPFERCVRTVSPSRYSTMCPRSSRSGPTRWAIVLLPEPESPVNHRVKPPVPFLVRLGMLVRVDVFGHFSSIWMPHSSLSEPAQRPARSSSSGLVGRVQGMHPIDRYPTSCSGL